VLPVSTEDLLAGSDELVREAVAIGRQQWLLNGDEHIDTGTVIFGSPVP
jgi:hypothetical protein